MPIKLPDAIVGKILPASMLGEHTDEILKQVCGFSGVEVVEMKEQIAFTNPK